MTGDLSHFDQQLGDELADQMAAGWLQHDDGSWWAVDDYGQLRQMTSAPVDEDLHADAQAALGAVGDPIDVVPLSVADTEVRPVAVDDHAPLTRCQRWTLESLAAVAPTRMQGTTVYELAALLSHDVRQTGVYLGELHRLRLVQYREYAGGLLWWVNDAGHAASKPVPSKPSREEVKVHQLASPGPDGNAGAMGGNSGADVNGDPARTEIAYGPGGWKSAKTSGLAAIDRYNS